MRRLEEPGHDAPGDTALLANCFFRCQRPADVEAFHRLAVEKRGYTETARHAETGSRSGHDAGVALVTGDPATPRSWRAGTPLAARRGWRLTGLAATGGVDEPGPPGAAALSEPLTMRREGMR
jgi:hypothetical protein